MPKDKGKTRVKLAGKEEKLVNALVTNSDNVAQAGRVAGYAHRQGAHAALRNIQKKAPELLAEMGYERGWSLRKLRELAEARRTRHFAHKGIVMESKDEEALEIQNAAATTLAKIEGFLDGGNDSPEEHNSRQITFRLEVRDERRARVLAEAIAPGRADSIVIDVAPELDENPRRARHGQSVQAVP